MALLSYLKTHYSEKSILYPNIPSFNFVFFTHFETSAESIQIVNSFY